MIVGAGAGGSTLAQRLAPPRLADRDPRVRPVLGPRPRLGLRRGRPHKLYWTAPRVIGGDDPVELGKNNSGHGVGGSMIHYAGYTPRFHPSDFEVRTPRRRRRRLADRLRGPQAALRARRARAAGRRPGLAVGRPAPLPARRRTRSPAAADEARAGASRAGIEMRVGPVGDPQRHLRQPAALHLPRLLPAGLQGQRQGLAVGHPPARRDRARRRGPRRLPRRPRRDRRERALHRRRLHARRPRALPARRRGRASAGYSIETPRLLLNSTSARFPHGLGNDARPGRALRHGPGRAAGRRPLPRAAAPVQGAAAGDLARSSSTRPTRRAGFARGFSIQTVGPLPIGWAEHVLADGHWGHALREYMRDYNHWTTLGVLCELLPQPDNRVTLADEHDRARHAGRAHGLHRSATTTARTSPTAKHGARAHLGGGRRAGHAGDRPLRAPRRRLPHGHLARGQRDRRRPPRLGDPRTSSSATAASCRPRERPTRR